MEGLSQSSSAGSNTSKDGARYREEVNTGQASRTAGGPSSGPHTDGKDVIQSEVAQHDAAANMNGGGAHAKWWDLRNRKTRGNHHAHHHHHHYKVYKRRWFGLAQLVLLNIVISWDVSSPWRIVNNRGLTCDG